MKEPILVWNMKNESILPKNFRTTEPLFKQKGSIDDLRLSGSGQFSEKSLELVLKKLNRPEKLYLLDLRQESHGFIDGDAVSWYATRDWGNVGKSLTEIEREECLLLEKALKTKDIRIGKLTEKDPASPNFPGLVTSEVTVKEIATEKQIAEKYSVSYFRIPIPNHVRPSDDHVDRFIDFFKQLPAGYWLHIHCSAGVGRTTSLMAMFDMMKNAKKFTLHEIFDRQVIVGGRDLRKPSGTAWKKSLVQERIRFLEDFYKYCRENQDGFETNWSLHLLLKLIDSETKTQT